MVLVFMKQSVDVICIICFVFIWKESLPLYMNNYKDTVTCIIISLDSHFYISCKQCPALWNVSTSGYLMSWALLNDVISPPPSQPLRKTKTSHLASEFSQEDRQPDLRTTELVEGKEGRLRQRDTQGGQTGKKKKKVAKGKNQINYRKKKKHNKAVQWVFGDKN